MAYKAINLGKKIDYPSDVKPAEPTNPVYPTLYIRDVDGLEDLPDGEFTFVATGKVVMSKEEMRNDVKECSYEIEVHSIKPSTTKDGSKPSEVSLAEALDEMEADDDPGEEAAE